MFNELRNSALGACIVLSAGLVSACGTSGGGSATSAEDITNTVIAETPASNSSSAVTTTTTSSTAASTTVTNPSDNPTVGQALGVGAAEIATADHDVLDDLKPSWGTGAIPASNAPDVVGAFRFICRHTNLAFDDPTVYPGQSGKSHLHDQTGVNGWNAFSNYGNLRVAGGGSGCNDVAGADHDPSKSTHSANRTPYWQPALLDGKGNVIVADFTSFYYKARPFAGPNADPVVTDPTYPTYLGKGVPLPEGIKFIFGAFPEDPSKAPTPAPVYQCVDPSGHPVATDGTFAGAVRCVKDNNGTSGAGYQLNVHMSAPQCWDGANLDSSDHRSHLVYPLSTGKCPPDHSYVIPTFTYAAEYTILASDDGDIHFSSDEMDNSKPRGWSFHVDYGPAAWDPVVLKMWTDGCINSFLNCSGGDLGNGKQLKGAAEPIYFDAATNKWTTSFRNPQRLVPVPPKS